MKYKLTSDSFCYDGNRLYRIQALKSFSDVEKGDFGGYIEGYHNLSQSGDCWVYPTARVSENAHVCDNAKVCGIAQLYGRTKVNGNDIVSD